MEFRISHRFPCTPQQYWDLLRQPDFEKEAQDRSQVDITVLLREEKNGRIKERFRIVSRRDLPQVAQKVTGVQRLAYEQELDGSLTDYSSNWKIQPLFLTDKVKCSGTTRIQAVAGGCERLIEGDIRVSIPIVGGQVEKHIISEIQRSYDDAAALITSRVQGR